MTNWFYTVICSTPENVVEIEDDLIQGFKPKYNKTYKGESKAFSIKCLETYFAESRGAA